MFAEIFDYDPETGFLRHKARSARDFVSSGRVSNKTRAAQWNNLFAGKEAGWVSVKDKYRRVSVGGVTYLAHRVAWYIHYNQWPSGQIDHIDGDRTNNKICNLRDVTCAINRRNVKIRSNNTSGISGVSWHKQRQKWQVRMKDLSGKYKSLGLYAHKWEAEEVRNKCAVKFGYTERHGR